MADDVLLNKASTIERCLGRILEEYRGHEAELETNFTRQDALLLNLLRACEASIDAPLLSWACPRKAGRHSGCWSRAACSRRI